MAASDDSSFQQKLDDETLLYVLLHRNIQAYLFEMEYTEEE
jgi:hypothetical protein